MPIITGIGITKIIMSSNPLYSLTKQLAVAFKLFFGATVFFTSFEMLRFGWLYSTVDINEVNASSAAHLKMSDIKQYDGWINNFGYRLYVRKQIAALYFQDDRTQFDTVIANDVLVNVLRISPLEPSYWLQYAKLKQLEYAADDEILSLLRMSYLTGRAVYEIMEPRFDLALSVWTKFDKSDKSIAINDFIYGPPRTGVALKTMMQCCDEQTQSEIINFVMIKNPNVAETLKKAIQGQLQ